MLLPGSCAISNGAVNAAKPQRRQPTPRLLLSWTQGSMVPIISEPFSLRLPLPITHWLPPPSQAITRPIGRMPNHEVFGSCRVFRAEARNWSEADVKFRPTIETDFEVSKAALT